MAARDWSRRLASVNKTSLLDAVSLDFVRTEPSSMHLCVPLCIGWAFLVVLPQWGVLNDVIGYIVAAYV